MKQGDGLWLAMAGALLVAALAIVLQTVLSLEKRRRSSGKKDRFPRGPPAWPIIGHLPLLTAGAHRVLADLCLKQGYGPIMGLRLGTKRAVIVSSAEFAKELLLTHDKAFANRVPYLFGNALFYGYNCGVALSSYNPRWVWLRKMYMVELFTAKRLEELGHVRQDEVRKLLHRLSEASKDATHAVDVGACVGIMTADTVARLLQSRTVSEMAPEMRELIRLLERESFPTIGDFFPFLRFLDALPKRRMQRLHARLDKVLSSIVDERRRLMSQCSSPREGGPNDFLQVILSKAKDSEEEDFSSNEVKGIILEMFGAGIHTSTAALEWGIAELLRNPLCLLKLRDEVDLVTKDKKKDLVDDEDVKKMPYLQNVVKELLRLHPVLPLLIPRMSSIDCNVGDYFLPKGTHAFVNVWAIGRDPLIWDNPQCFRPERFEGSDLDMRGQNYEFLPFGAGRRMCPGMRLGVAVVQVTLANLVKFFDWALPHGESPSSMDMSENGAFSSYKGKPMLAIAKVRECIPVS